VGECSPRGSSAGGSSSKPEASHVRGFTRSCEVPVLEVACVALGARELRRIGRYHATDPALSCESELLDGVWLDDLRLLDDYAIVHGRVAIGAFVTEADARAFEVLGGGYCDSYEDRLDDWSRSAMWGTDRGAHDFRGRVTHRWFSEDRERELRSIGVARVRAVRM
jgi:hypothetical protein